MLLDVGEVDARRARGLEVRGADEGELAVGVFGDVFCGGGFLLLAFGELAGFGGGFFLGLVVGLVEGG